MNDTAALILTFGITVAMCASASAEEPGTTHELLSQENLPKWQLAREYEKRPAWQLQDGVYSGVNSIVAYPQQFTNFVLECDFLFQGKGEGGIQLRGEATAVKSWTVGYELDVDWAADRKHGHIHFPVNPKPYGGEALFTVGEWHAVRVTANGPKIVVQLDGKQILQFEDGEYLSGQICLQGEKDGVLYRNIKVTELK